MIPSNSEFMTAARIVAQSRRALPDGYQLSDNDVYCGRGSLGVTHIGNKKFRDLVLANADRYVNATSKFERSIIIYEIVDYIRSNSPNGGFVKNDNTTGCLYEVGDLAAREKASQAFRDATQGKYKSSRMTKARNRMTDKLRKACERYSSTRINPSPTIPVSDSDNSSPVLSSSSSSSATSSQERSDQRYFNTNECQPPNIQNDMLSDYEILNSVWNEESYSDQHNFTSFKNDYISVSHDMFDSNLLQDNKFDLSALSTSATSHQDVIQDTKEFDAITFDLLLQLVNQNSYNMSQESFEPRPIE